MPNMSCGIYKYQNLINQKIYIGKAQRIRDHRYDASNPGRNNCIFHKALRKYGEENFTSEIVEEWDKSILDERE